MALFTFDKKRYPVQTNVSLVVTLLLLIAFPFIASQFGNSWVRIMDIALLYIMLALGLNIVVGFAGLLDLGYIAFYAIGAYTAGLLASPQFADVLQSFVDTYPALGHFLVSISGAEIAQHGIHLTIWVIVPLSAFIAALFGALLGAPTLKLRGDYLAIVTLGFGEIIRVIFQNMESVGAASGLKGIPHFTNFFWSWTCAAITVYAVACLVNSTYGRGFIAVHDDEVAAGAMGINGTRYKVTAFVVGAFFAGIAGGLFAHHKVFLSPTGFDFTKSIEIVVMVILGGMGRTAGVILAAIVLTLLPEVLRPIASYRMILYALLIIGLMLLRPQGLFHWNRRSKRA